MSFKRTFKKTFSLFGYSILTTITLPLHTPLPKEIHSLICWCISPIKMIFRINCFSSLIIIKHKTKKMMKSHNGRKKSRKDVSATRPGHANNKQTHNYGKPIFTLLQMKNYKFQRKSMLFRGYPAIKN